MLLITDVHSAIVPIKSKKNVATPFENTCHILESIWKTPNMSTPLGILGSSTVKEAWSVSVIVSLSYGICLTGTLLNPSAAPFFTAKYTKFDAKELYFFPK